MTNLTLKELAHLNRIVKKNRSRFQCDSTFQKYAHRSDADCPAFIQRSRIEVAELTALSKKLEQMMLEAEN